MFRSSPIWLITGVAGFIGSNLLESLLKLNQTVIGLDNFSTGHRHNLEEVQRMLNPDQWNRFTLIEGDIRHLDTCKKACENADIVLHQAALGSVPGSIEDPLLTNDINVNGFINMLMASKDTGVKRFVFAGSSAIYGDSHNLPQKEEIIGRSLSPYAITKYINELYADIFSQVYKMEYIGLRYFNVFGPRQDPDGAYAAVIPKWFSDLIMGNTVYINGDGKTSRDFCYIDNCVQANLLAALTENPNAVNQIYNVSLGRQTTLDELFIMIRACVSKLYTHAQTVVPVYRDFRPGDICHSLADIAKAKSMLEYDPRISVQEGLGKSANWYINYFS